LYRNSSIRTYFDYFTYDVRELQQMFEIVKIFSAKKIIGLRFIINISVRKRVNIVILFDALTNRLFLQNRIPAATTDINYFFLKCIILHVYYISLKKLSR